MNMHSKIVAEAIDTAPLNRGLKGDDWLAFPGNVAIVNDTQDVTLFDTEGDGIFEIHVLYQSRGRDAIDAAREAMRAMFEKHDASLIYGMVPDARSDVKLLARWSGMRSAGIRWMPEGPGLGLTKFELFVLSKFMWKVANS